MSKGSGLWIIVLRAAEGNACVLSTADLAKAAATCASTRALLPSLTTQDDMPLDSSSCCNCLRHTRLDSASSTWLTLLWFKNIVKHRKARSPMCSTPLSHDRLPSCPCVVACEAGAPHSIASSMHPFEATHAICGIAYGVPLSAGPQPA